MKTVLRYFNKYKLITVLAPLFKFFEAALELLVPLVIASIIDRGIANNDTQFILSRGGVLVVFALVGLAFSLTAQYFSARSAIGACTDIRAALMDKVHKLSYARLDSAGEATLITRLTSDVISLQTGINLTLRLLLRSPFVVFGAMAVAFTIDKKCALIFAAVIAVLIVIVFFIMEMTIPRHADTRHELDLVTEKARENLAGVRVIRAFLMEESEKAEFKKRIVRLEKMQIAVGRLSAMLNPATLVAVNIAAMVLIHTGAWRVDTGTLSRGQLVALYNLLTQILAELVKSANLVINVSKSIASAKRISAVLEMDDGRQAGKAVPNGTSGEVEFKNVSFAYENAGENSLFDISFKAAGGQTVGIIGGTGSGKSTLGSLIAGFFMPSAGEVLIDGVSTADMERAELQKRVSIAPQKAVLLSGTIRENLLMGDENADDKTLIDALEKAQALDFVLARENGLDEEVLRGGSNFSGGQKQRLAVARALVKKSEILVLDDSASALDYATDAKLRAALNKLNPKRTAFIISQRAASVKNADLIIVLDEGRAVGMGKHESLIASCPIYRQICELQLGSEVAK